MQDGSAPFAQAIIMTTMVIAWFQSIRERHWHDSLLWLKSCFEEVTRGHFVNCFTKRPEVIQQRMDELRLQLFGGIVDTVAIMVPLMIVMVPREPMGTSLTYLCMTAACFAYTKLPHRRPWLMCVMHVSLLASVVISAVSCSSLSQFYLHASRRQLRLLLSGLLQGSLWAAFISQVVTSAVICSVIIQLNKSSPEFAEISDSDFIISQVSACAATCVILWCFSRCLQIAAEVMHALDSSSVASKSLLSVLCDVTVEPDSEFQLVGECRRLIQMFPSTFLDCKKNGLDGSNFLSFLHEDDRSRLPQLVKHPSSSAADLLPPSAAHVRLNRADGLTHEIDIHVVTLPNCGNNSVMNKVHCLVGMKVPEDSLIDPLESESSSANPANTDLDVYELMQHRPCVPNKSSSSGTHWTKATDNTAQVAIKHISLELDLWSPKINVLSAKISFNVQALRQHPHLQPTLADYLQNEVAFEEFKQWLQDATNACLDDLEVPPSPAVVLRLPGDCGALFCKNAELGGLDLDDDDDEEEEEEECLPRSKDPGVGLGEVFFSNVTELNNRRARFSLERFRKQHQQQRRRCPAGGDSDTEQARQNPPQCSKT
eukprot:TRINITY_DN12765_c0_g1_i2.p1 TRINITY_DN12765_c0_g1~~TRINITY_DN12765_c0_g1_i2.p1  ORF type:complete len:598 (-),score=87.34 TRINITY_DN12765_c0_g1_i2:115-1908(-)